ncbi:MAG: DUF6438 domain-containing protein [Acidobacteriota bacterium]
MWTISRINLLLILSALAAPSAFAHERQGNRIQKRASSEQGVPRDTLITLERTGCYGMCPIYKLTISADGSVLFEGNRFVKKVGTAKSAISQEQIRELIVAFEKINYFDLKDRYERPEDDCKQWVTDHPSALTSITLNGTSKSVIHYYGCRGVEVLAKLEKLEQAIDDAVNSAQWIR